MFDTMMSLKFSSWTAILRERMFTVSGDDTNTCDVDHFFPHTLQPLFPDINLDGVWNLVLVCSACNRGEGGKFARVPATKYLTRLHK